MSILISGSTGFLGSYLIKSFVKLQKFEVIALKRSSSNIFRINSELNKTIFYDTDKIELKEIFSNHKIDIVINTVTDYGNNENRISKMVETNVLFCLRLLEESLNNRVELFINTDTLLPKQINPYSLSKAQFVDWIKLIETGSTRIANVKIEHMYGPLDNKERFISWTINQIRENVDKLDLTSGIQKRDFIFVDDVVSAYHCIIDNINLLSSFEEFELGSGYSTTIKNVVELIYQKIKKHQTVNTFLNFGAFPYRKDENMEMLADISKLIGFGWEPKICLGDGIERTIRNH